ncbi:MAG: MarR family winged helix-turn-helix transcriptional regulator [Clostridiaceae bacterium]
MDKEIHIGKRIFKLANKIDRKISNDVTEYGITSVQARILGFLYRNLNKRDIFQKDIEKELDTRRSSVTSVLNLMEKNQFIRRESVSEDARLKKIVLTDKGLEMNKKVHDSIHSFENSLRDEFTEDEFNLLIKLIDRLHKKIAD